MTSLETTIYDALIEAGTSKEKAKAAAEAIGNSSSFQAQEKLDLILTKVTTLETQMKMVQWIVGGVGFGLIAAVFVKLFE